MSSPTGPSAGLWNVYRVTPGDPPEAAPWRFEGGELPAAGVACAPQAAVEGTRFVDCAPAPARPFDALLLAGASGEPTLVVRTAAGDARLTRLWTRDEPAASANVGVRWQHVGDPALGGHGDVWADAGVVFVPREVGVIELLAASDGRVLGSLDTRVGQVVAGGPGWILDLKSRDGLLYVSTVARGVLIFDVRDPARPRFLGQRFTPYGGAELPFANVHNLFLSPTRPLLYAINHSYAQTDLRIIDVADPAAPRDVGTYRVPEHADIYDGAHDVHIVSIEGREIAFLHAMRSGWFVLDASDPAAPRTLATARWPGIFRHSGWPFRSGGRLYYAHADEGPDQGVTVLDLSDLAQPRIVSRFQTRRGTSVHEIEVVDGIAYLAYYIDGLRVVDLRDPARPREIGHFDTVAASNERDVLQGAWSVRVLDGQVFLSDGAQGIYAFALVRP